MKIIEIKNLTFHRNGVAGEPFYSCVVKTDDEKDLKFLVSFTSKNDKSLAPANCRAVCLDALNSNWRGDVFAYALNDWFVDRLKNNGGTIYDECDKKDLQYV